MRYIYYDYINRPFQEQNIIMLSNRETNKLNLYKSNEWNVLSSNDTIEVNRDSIIDLVLLRLKKNFQSSFCVCGTIKLVQIKTLESSQKRKKTPILLGYPIHLTTLDYEEKVCYDE